MPQLILIRHGNTFEADQTPTFVGGRTDMKLTTTGEKQGEAIAQMIKDHFAPVEAIISGPLLRTHRFAELIAAPLSQVFTVDERLCEIDYGLWENKTTAEVRAAHGDTIVDAWEKQGAWPDDMNWAPSLAKFERNVKALLTEQHKKLQSSKAHNRVIITSNGFLRFAYRAITGLPPDQASKVGTGRYCLLSPTTDGWTIEKWNEKPS